MTNRYRACNQGGNKGRKSEQTFEFLLRFTTRVTVKEMIERGIEIDLKERVRKESVIMVHYLLLNA